MGLFDRFRRAVAYRPDPCVGDPEGRAFLAALVAGDLDRVRAAVAATATPARLEFLCEVAATADGRPAVLDAWVEEEPDSARALLVRGVHGVGWAWEARGRATADRVTDDAFEAFFERLRAAESDLLAAAQRDPSDGVAWSQLVTSGRGLQIPKAELLARHRNAVERAPTLLRVDLELVQGISAKWSGSDEEAVGFARDTTRGTPDGAPVHAVIPSAHTESWISDDRHLRRGDVQDEIAAAAERSIWHPDWLDVPEHVVALNHFCLAFHLGGAAVAAERTARQIARRYTAAPWRYVGGPPAGLRALR
jgi:hypothetical protein